jgi:D-alanyl-lipoteichoic acid acyltransferase DltB (MBOAT superfamily)
MQKQILYIIMNLTVLIGLLSSICSIIGLFISDKFKSNRWFYAIFIFIMTLACGYAVHYNSELERVKNIHKQANAIYEHYNPYSINNYEFIQESLVFLEENKDRYYDAYTRAYQINLETEKSDSQYDSEPAKKIRGIIKGIATLNKE